MQSWEQLTGFDTSNLNWDGWLCIAVIFRPLRPEKHGQALLRSDSQVTRDKRHKMKSRLILSTTSKSSRTGWHCLDLKQYKRVGHEKKEWMLYWNNLTKVTQGVGVGMGVCEQPNPSKQTELRAEASTPMPSQGDEPVFTFLMTLETKTYEKHNDSFVLIQWMVWKKKKAKSPALQVTVCHSVLITCVK